MTRPTLAELSGLLDDPEVVRLEAEWSQAEREWVATRRGEKEAAETRLHAAVEAYKARLADLGLLERERVSDVGTDRRVDTRVDAVAGESERPADARLD